MQQGLALAKWQLIEHALHESVLAVVADHHVVATEVQIEGRTAPVVPAPISHVRPVSQSLRERVGGSQQQPAAHLVIKPCLQGVVVRAGWLKEKVCIAGTPKPSATWQSTQGPNWAMFQVYRRVLRTSEPS